MSVQRRFIIDRIDRVGQPGIGAGGLVLYSKYRYFQRNSPPPEQKKYGAVWMPGFYAVHTLCLLCMPFATRSLPTGLAAVFLLGILMYLVNSPSQMLFLNTAAEEYPSCVNLAASFNSVFFNLGIAAGSFLGGLVVDHAGLRFVGAAGAVPAVLAGSCAFLLTGIMKKRDRKKLMGS